MGSFGLVLYGPYQHYWYRALERAFTARTLTNFATKVALNQLCLAPVVISAVFAWNLGLQQRLGEWPDKARQDFVPTLLNGAPGQRLPAACLARCGPACGCLMHAADAPPLLCPRRLEVLGAGGDGELCGGPAAAAGALHERVRGAVDRLPLLLLLHQDQACRRMTPGRAQLN